MKVSAVLVLAALAPAAGGPSRAQPQPPCPVGAVPSVDSWGNRICRRADGSTATAQAPNGQTCPIGAVPTVDAWGTRICRSEASGAQPRTDSYDTRKGCPTGSIPSVDSWGAKVCKPF
jgi:hypothetical protein